MQVLGAEEPLTDEHEEVAERKVFRLECTERVCSFVLKLIKVHDTVNCQTVRNQEEKWHNPKHS